MAGGSGLAGDGGSEASSFLGMVALLSDPQKLQGEYQRLKDAQAQAQSVIDLAGPASEVVALRDQLKAAEALMASRIEEANAQAAAIVAAATARGEAIRAQGESDAQSMRAGAQAVADAAMADSAAVTAHHEQVAAMESDVEKREAALSDAQAALASKETDLAAREAALAAKAQSLVDAQAEIAKVISRIAR